MKISRWLPIALWILGTMGIVYGAIYADVVVRAKESFEQGEKYWRWSEHPEEYAQFLSDKFTQEKDALDQRFGNGKLKKEDYDRQLSLVQFDREQSLKESTMKYAYTWYQTAVELYSPPESKWVRLSREKMPQAKERWKSELRAQHIPFEDYMLD